MKTARFTDVVSEGGRPELHLTWSAPASDKVLQTASKQHRVLTLYQQTRGSKKDHAVVGVETDPHAQYLVFPKSLRRFADRRIVGINYDLLREGLSTGGKLPPPRGRAPRKKSVPKPSPKIVRFEAPERAPLPRILKQPAPPPDKEQAPAPSLHFPKPEEKDPMRREIRLAIGDLKAGHALKARRRLEAWLKEYSE